MNRKTLLALCSAGVCFAMIIALGLIPTKSHAQSPQPVPRAVIMPAGYTIPAQDQPCILSGNRLHLQCIIANDPDAVRIRGEEAMLESQALAAAQSGTLDAFHQVQTLGKLEVFDPSLSVNGNLACSYCHDPAAGYANGVSILSVFTGGSNPGSVPIAVHGEYPNNRIAKRNPQAYVYATYFPPLQYLQAQGEFYGGNFWDGRATGYRLQNSSAEQGQDPPTDPEEMANPDPACVVWKLSQSKYASFFEQVWGAGSLSAITFPTNVSTVCGTPKGASQFGSNATPLTLSAEDRTRAMQAFDEFGQAIASYEASSDVSPFTSKFDYSLQGKATLTAQEQIGYDLFRGKGNCNSCHLDGTATSHAQSQATAADVRPLFTDTTYNNLGLPKNPNLPWYYENTPDQFGFTGNPQGLAFIDEGMGLFLRGYYGAPPNMSWGTLYPQFQGKFQTSTVRDAAMVPNSGFIKAYMHNGYLSSLKEVVHFYNTRDVYAYPVTSGNCPAGTVEKVNCWPMSEVPANLNMTIGNLRLNDNEENAIVSFLQTLVDGYKP